MEVCGRGGWGQEGNRRGSSPTGRAIVIPLTQLLWSEVWRDHYILYCTYISEVIIILKPEQLGAFSITVCHLKDSDTQNGQKDILIWRVRGGGVRGIRN